MRPDELERLLWEQTDGSINPEDRARLDAYLADNPTAERQRRDVKAFAELLGSVGEVEPPANLRPRINAALASRPGPRPRFSWAALAGELLAPKWRVRLAWAVVGLVIGMTATALIVADFGRTSREDISRFYGSMTLPDAASARPLRVILDGGLGVFGLSAKDGLVLIDLEVSRPVAGGVAVELLGDGLRIESFQGAGTAASRIEAGGKTVVATLGGPGHMVVRIQVPTQVVELAVRVSSGGKQLVERRIEVRNAPRG